MDSTTHDSHASDGFWTKFGRLFGLAAGLFALFSGTALIQGGIRASRAKGQPQPSAAAPAAASAPAPAAAAAPAAPAAPTTGAGGEAVIVLKPGSPNPMSFDQTSFNVKAGQKVKLTFNNNNPTAPLQHNFILGALGSKDRLIAASNAMMTDMPKWMPKGFVPESPDVIAHTKLLNPGETETIEFKAPAEKGDYPYMCTFPGHSLVMQGTMKVE